MTQRSDYRCEGEGCQDCWETVGAKISREDPKFWAQVYHMMPYEVVPKEVIKRSRCGKKKE